VHGRRGDHRDLLDLPKPLVLGMEAVGVVEQSEHPGSSPATGLPMRRARSAPTATCATFPRPAA
jgi:hypothetical protein